VLVGERGKDVSSDADASIRRKADPRNPDDWGRFGQARRRTNVIANVGLALVLAMLITRGVYWIWPHWVLVRVYFSILIGIPPTLLGWLASVYARNQMRCPWCTRSFYPRDMFGRTGSLRGLYTIRCLYCRTELPRKLR